MKQNKRALTTHKAGERLSEKRQELIDFRQSLGVPGIALQHRPTSWHVESGRIHRVHLSSVVLDRSSSGRKKKRRSDSTRLQSRRQPTYHQCRWTWACKSVEWNAREISADMLVFTSHALKPLHLNVCPSSTARNTARSSSSLSDKSTSTLIRLKTHSAMHFHNFLHNFFFIQQQHTGGALHPTGPPITTKFKQRAQIASSSCPGWTQSLFAVLFHEFIYYSCRAYTWSASDHHSGSTQAPSLCYCPPLSMALPPLQKKIKQAAFCAPSLPVR